MDKVFIDLWPFIVTAIIGAIGWMWKKVLNMSERLVIMETNMNTCKTNMSEDMTSMREKIDSEVGSIQKTIDKMQQRQDSHSRKQDEIVKLITDFKFEVIRQIGELSSDMKALNSTLEVFDSGARFDKKKKGK